ncbi:unnamed protein product [Sphagnum troendelagicum]|uniref:Uncharacterized protein n=1 Tax=Sphagnum troendelagicum TaxID=128251 RepID=A0ABP0U7P3_9BRYO
MGLGFPPSQGRFFLVRYWGAQSESGLEGEPLWECSVSSLELFCRTSRLDLSLLRLRRHPLSAALRRWFPGFPAPTLAPHTQKTILRNEGEKGIERNVPEEEGIGRPPRPRPMMLAPVCSEGGSPKVTVDDSLHALLHRSFPRLLARSGLELNILPGCWARPGPLVLGSLFSLLC